MPFFPPNYEVHNHPYNGMDLMVLFNLTARGYLITSYAEKIAIQQFCQELDLWLVPKSLVAGIKLEVR